MKMIMRKIYSHRTIDGDDKQKMIDLRSSEPLLVSNYKQLVELVAKISYNNRDFNIYFRGQDREYLWPKNKRTMILPTIYRDLGIGKEVHSNFMSRMKLLEKAEKELIKMLSSHQGQHDETFQEFKEIRWAILQHYRVCDTPLIDLTTSLRAACSFVLNNNRKDGILYILGLPNINGSISFYVEENLSILKLISICPPFALRPHFQDGYLACNFPIDTSCFHMRFNDFSRRLLAKFKLNNVRGKFWNKDFRYIPENALYPNDNDEVYRICENIKALLSV